MQQPLDNIFWHALTGPHAKYAAGMNGARRYAPGFSPIAGFADVEHPDLSALRPFCQSGEQLYCSGWSGPAPDGWRIESESMMTLMAWDPARSAAEVAAGFDIPIVRLGPAAAAAALELASLTRPGPFGPRTIELGEYFGAFFGQRLIAMAGERVQFGTLHEISGICTHPEFRGRGIGYRLTAELVTRQLQRGEQPFLHVISDNSGARRLYERMGFRDHAQKVVRIISPC